MANTRDQDRFEQFIDAHKAILYKVSRAYCVNPDGRDDLVQEILMQLWRAFPRYDASRKFSTWMYRIALNVAISFYRSESARQRPLVAGEEMLLQVEASSALDPPGMAELYRYIESLDAMNRALLLLHLDGYSYQESAEVLGLTETNVATRLSRLKARMREELKEGKQS